MLALHHEPMISGNLFDSGLKVTWFLSSRDGRREQVVALVNIIRFVAPFYGTLTNTIEMLRRTKVISQRDYPLRNPNLARATIASESIALIKCDTSGAICSHASMQQRNHRETHADAVDIAIRYEVVVGHISQCISSVE